MLSCAKINNAYASTQDEYTAIKISYIHPAPNYRLTTDSMDNIQLTDNRTHNYPIWTNKKAVGWKNRSPIKINGEIVHNNKSQAGTFRIHSSKGTHASVQLPLQIDIYTSEDNKLFQLSGSTKITSSHYNDKRNYWIDIPATLTGKYFQILIFANGHFIFIDEISFKNEKTQNSLAAIHHNNISVNNIVNQSTKLLHNNKQKSLEKTIKKAINESNSYQDIAIWSLSPWSDNIFPNGKASSSNSNEVFHYFTVKNKYQSHSLVVFNNSPRNLLIHPKISHQNTIKLESSYSIKLNEVKPVLAANGELVFDIIEPISKDEILLSPDKFIVFTLEWRTIENNTITLQLNEKSLGNFYTAEIKSKIFSPRTSEKLSQVLWDYSIDTPIWNNINVVKNFLRTDLGLDTHVIHQSLIPQPKINGPWDKETAIKLKNEINNFKDTKKLIFFLGWAPNTRPKWLSPNSNIPETKQKIILEKWLTKLTSLTKQLGLNYDQWLLFPIDEPDGGNKLKMLKKIIKLINNIDPNINFYVNPSYSRKNGNIDDEDLKELNNYVSVWQPNIKLLERYNPSFFKRLNKPWWIYKVPQYPAKSANLWSDYGRIGIKAWQLGAQGVGLWSLSRVRNSSAWNDFDGEEPDWATVYETKNSILPSRRLRAYMMGNSEYYLLSYIDNLHNKSTSCSLSLNKLRKSKTLSSTSYISHKQEIIKACL